MAHGLASCRGARCITAEIEQALPEALRVLLDQVRAEERQSTGAE
jgi:hypothetical protein